MKMNGRNNSLKTQGNARKQILTAILATIPTFTYGIQIGWLSPMGHVLKARSPPLVYDFHITWMAAALPLAAICGIPFFSYASDRFGRKICIIAVSLLSGASWILKLSVVTPPALIAARMIAGAAAGGCFIVVPVYIKEIAEDAWRGALASLVMTVCKVGVIFVYTLGMTASYSVNQVIYLTIALGHALVFLFMPESPNFLLKIGKDKRAARTIAWLRGVGITSTVVTEEVAAMRAEQLRVAETPQVTLLSVVRDRAAFSALRMTLTLMAMQTLSGCFALMNYASGVFERAGSQWSPDVLAVLMGTLQLAGSFFTTMSIEKFGRKLPLAASSLVVSVCMAALGTCLLVGRSAAPSALPAAAVCLAVLAYGVGLAPVPMVIMAEVFSFQLRARMAGASMAFSFFCSSMTVLFYTPISQQFGEHVVFYIFSTITAFGILYTAVWVPETKGKTLEQIQKFWGKEPKPVFV